MKVACPHCSAAYNIDDRRIPATGLNVLAACWIQFQNHDWFSHGDNEPDTYLEVSLQPDDPWGEDVMTIRATARPASGRR